MLTGTARSYGHLFLARIGVGAGEATLGPAAVSIIAGQFPPKRLGVAMSTYMMGTFLGSGVAYALGAYVVGRVDKPGLVSVPLVGDVFPWQLVFFFVGLPGLLVALLALTIREPRVLRAPTEPALAAAQAPFADVLSYLRANARTVGALNCRLSANWLMLLCASPDSSLLRRRSVESKDSRIRKNEGMEIFKKKKLDN